MYISREQVYSELKRLYDNYNPNKRQFVDNGRSVVEDDQVTIYTSYRWKGPEGRWILTNYYMGKYMDTVMPSGLGEADEIGECYSKITFDPYVPKETGQALNLVWNDSTGGFFDMLGNRLIIEYHYKNREMYLASFLAPEEAIKIK